MRRPRATEPGATAWQIVEFIRLAGGEAKICEYNQEACRLNAYDGKKSLIRSFPSKVGVSAVRLEPGEG